VTELVLILNVVNFTGNSV